MEDLIKALNDALDRKGISASAASKAAVGNPSAIKNILALAKRSPNERASALQNLSAIADYLELEFYVGPRRIQKRDVDIASKDYASIRRYGVDFSAGSGKFNPDELPASPLSFRIDWLARKGLNPAQCAIVHVSGDSMEPTLFDGDSVMLDRQSTTVQDMRLYGIVDIDGSAKIKRLQCYDSQLILHSDNRNHPAAVRKDNDANQVIIIGRVVWSGHDFQL